MKDLIKVEKKLIGRDEVNAVDGRELHGFLGSKQEFANWIGKRISKYTFMQGIDFIKFDNFIKSDSKPRTDYTLSIDMAKELSMVENNQQGRLARKYFIACEKKLVSLNQTFQIPKTMSEALRFAADQQDQIQQLENQAIENRPKLALVSKIEASTNSIQIGDYVKVISKENCFVIGRNNFYKWLRDAKILNSSNMPYQRYIDCGWLEVKEGTFENENTNGPRATFTTYITGKGQVAILERFEKSDSFPGYLNKAAGANKSLKGTG